MELFHSAKEHIKNIHCGNVIVNLNLLAIAEKHKTIVVEGGGY